MKKQKILKVCGIGSNVKSGMKTHRSDNQAIIRTLLSAGQGGIIPYAYILPPVIRFSSDLIEK